MWLNINETTSLSVGKNVFEIGTAKAAQIVKSYHSSTLPIVAAGTARPTDDAG
jgi:hypothetical protein